MSDERPMIGVTRRVVLGPKEDVTFQAAIDPGAGEEGINSILDILSDVAERERWKAELAEKRLALKVAEQQNQFLDRQIADLMRDRAAAVAGFQAAHAARARRTEFAPNERQKQAIEQFDAQIKAAQESKANFRRDKPIIEWEIDCLAARIAGEAEPERPQEADEAILRIVEAAA